MARKLINSAAEDRQPPRECGRGHVCSACASEDAAVEGSIEHGYIPHTGIGYTVTPEDEADYASFEPEPLMDVSSWDTPSFQSLDRLMRDNRAAGL